MLAIIGGTGFQNIDGMTLEQEHVVPTPFGAPSAAIAAVRSKEHRVLFLPRHGFGHALMPSEINFRANIFALKYLGATHILGISAVGSLVEHIRPGEFAFPSQYFDWTKGVRKSTFFGEGLIGHIATADPVCPALTRGMHSLACEHGGGRTVHLGKTYACVEGPRLGTRAESFFLKNAGCDLVGMSNVPEAFLAREAQICYASLCVVTDYDSWLEDPAQHVSVEKVFELYGQSVEDVKSVVRHAAMLELETGCIHCRTLAQSIIPSSEQLSPERQQLLTTLLR